MSRLFNTLIFVFTLCATFFLYTPQANAQLMVNGGLTAEELVEILVGTGVEVSNISLDCPTMSFGSFDGTYSNLGIEDGILLTSGDINAAVGPNDTGSAGEDNYGDGDPDLSAIIAPDATMNACVLEFDFVPFSDALTFNYVFGSEEYLEFVDQFNDVFAFIISGPGYPAPTNIALIPGTTTPISINNVNDVDNSEFYVNNGDGGTPDPNSTVQYDGFTTVLATNAPVTPCETYHLKLAIADAVDTAYDSGVFLQGGSLSTDVVEVDAELVNLTDDLETAIEGCVDAVITFSIGMAQPNDLEIVFELSGDAVNGDDYDLINTTTVIPAGETTVSIDVNTINDGIAEGVELLTISYTNPVSCDSVMTQSVSIMIDDQTPLEVSEDVEISLGDSVELLATGGGLNYDWTPTETLVNPNTANPTATPTETTVYTVTSTIGDCEFTETVTITVIECEADAGIVSNLEFICGDAFDATVEGNNADIDYVFWLVDGDNIVVSNATGVFVDIPAGDYCVHGVSYEAGADDTPNLEITTVSELLAQTEACWSLSECSPIQVNSQPDAGTVAIDNEIICGGDNVTTSIDGELVLPGDVLMYALHNSPDGDITMPGFTIYDTSADGIFTNNGSAPTNTTLYISSVVGDDDGTGKSDLTDPCLSVSPGVGVVYLKPVGFIINEFCDYGIGDYHVNVMFVGGLPEYDNAAFYSVTGDLLESAIFGQMYSIIIAEGDANNYSFTVVEDGNGCTADIISEDFLCTKTPIELLTLDGEARTEGNLITWLTASEIDNDYFTLERSQDGENFEVIATIEGAGNSSSILSYEYLDTEAPAELSYYQLSQTDINGVSEMVGTIALFRGELVTGFEINQISPVPANEYMEIGFTVVKNGLINLNIYDITGKRVQAKTIDAVKGYNSSSLDIADVSTGVYLITLSYENEMVSTKFLKQ